jgi:hypothetical protein
MVLVDMDVLTESLFALPNEVEVFDSHLECQSFGRFLMLLKTQESRRIGHVNQSFLDQHMRSKPANNPRSGSVTVTPWPLRGAGVVVRIISERW